MALLAAAVASLPAASGRASSERSSSSPATASPSGSFPRRRTSILPSQKAVLRSSTSISGRADGFNVLYVPKVANGDVDENSDETEKEYRLLCDWMKQNLGDKVAKVTVSKRISSSPCVLVSGKFGWSANMERIMKAQTLGDNSQMEFMRGRRILEINPNHPIIQDLNVACKDTPRSPSAQGMANLLYETALLSSGFMNPAEFGAPG